MPHQLLLADDSVTIQRVIKLTFADEDVEVVTVGDGEQAVAAIDKQPPDIVLADVGMPGLSGYEVAEHIRTSPKLAHIPVLLLTGAFEPVDEARASAVGCDGVLAKPFEPDVVVARVKELLARPRQASPTPGAVAPTAAPSRPEAPAAVAPAPPQAPKPVAAPTPPPLVFPVKTPATATAVAAPVAAAAPRPADVDAYFDRLDQAFATLALSPRAPAAMPQSTDASPVSAQVPAAVAVAPPPAPASPLTSQALADVFAGLSAVATPAAVAPTTPTLAAPPVPAPAPAPFPQAVALTDAQLEQIVNRVLERLTARLGDPAAIVANVAERLVRAEIAQIKSRL